jgi:hypothetical protein
MGCAGSSCFEGVEEVGELYLELQTVTKELFTFGINIPLIPLSSPTGILRPHLKSPSLSSEPAAAGSECPAADQIFFGSFFLHG